MEAARPPFQKYVFVCENERPEGACCMPAGTKIRELLKEKVKQKGLSKQIRVSRSGCLDVCSEGPNVLVMPDNVWFKKVRIEDADAIIQQAMGSV